MSLSICARAVIAAGLLASTTSATFVYGSNKNNIVYWGQGDSQIKLSQVCSDPTVDVVNVAFVDGFPQQVGDYPVFNLANACWADYYPDPHDSSKNSQLFRTCPGVGDAVTACQNAGKKVLLSIGGGSPNNYYLPSKQVAKYFAEFLLGAFGPVTPAWTAANKPRPLGDAVFDGFDLDLEATTGTVSSPNDIYAYYSDFVNHARTLQPSILISGAPQCHRPEARFDNIIPNTWFDWLNIQFYNNNDCSARLGYEQINQTSTGFNFDAWVAFVQANSVNPAVKLVLGLPAGVKGAGAAYPDHYLTPEEANALATKYQKKYPGVFGGIMLWEATVSAQNIVRGQDYAYWAKAIVDGTFDSKYYPVASSSSSRMSSSTRVSSSRASSSSSIASSTHASSSAASSTRASSSVASSTRVSSYAASSSRASSSVASSTPASSTRASSSVASSTRASSSASSSTRASSSATWPTSSSTPASSYHASSSSAKLSGTSVASSYSAAATSLTSIKKAGVSLSSGYPFSQSGYPSLIISSSTISAAGATTAVYSTFVVKSSSAPYPILNVSSSATSAGYPVTYVGYSQAAVPTPCSTAQVQYSVQGQAYNGYSANGNYNSPSVTKTPAYGYDTSPYSSTTTTITTTYVDVCETGLITKTAYITKTVCLSCAKPTKAPECPEGWTTSVYIDKTTTLTITKPITITITNVANVPSYPSMPPQPNYPQGGYPVSSAQYPQQPAKSYPAVPGVTSTKVITLTKVAVPYTPVPYVSAAAAYTLAPNAPSAVPYAPIPYNAKNATTASVPQATSGSSSKPASYTPAQFQGAASRVGTGITAVFVIVAGFFLL